MATKVIMPKQGLQMEEGTILQWFNKEGDTVKEGDPLFEIETDKLTIEIDAPGSGKLLKIINNEGDVVPITEVVAVIGQDGEDISELIAGNGSNASSAVDTAVPAKTEIENKSAPETAGSSKGTGRTFASPRARMLAEQKGISLDAVLGSGPDGLIIERDILSAKAGAKATPLAKRVADEQGIVLNEVTGSGPSGKIYTRDLPSSVADTPASTVNAPAAEVVRKPLKGMRKVIAGRMRSSLDTAAQANHNVDVDMSEAVRMRESLKESGIKVSYNDIILKTAAYALKQMPKINSSLQGDEILSFSNVNIGIAVALPEGLIVPVMNNVDQKSLEEINAESKAIGEKAKGGKLVAKDLSGATFTVSNLGMFGLDRFTAIINEPESGILAVGAIKDKPVAIDKKLEVRPLCSLTLTYDHRVIDGAPAAEFLMLIKSILENPYRLI